MSHDNKLDNPVWHSLNETHAGMSINYNNLKCYHPDYCPFGGYQPGDSISNYLEDYVALIDNFFIVGEKPAFPPILELKDELVCLQMIIDQQPTELLTEKFIRLNGAYENELFELVNLVQPGYFRHKTVLLGDYYGIFKNDRLVSVTGERMKMNECTEISAVVTHPDYVGQGYAKQLIAFVVNKIREENKHPFLHVAETNTGAIHLYEKMGFTTRRKISFWNVRKKL
jgi:GNAT superfamily N-acetyltransferase